MTSILRMLDAINRNPHINWQTRARDRDLADRLDAGGIRRMFEGLFR